MIGFLRRVFFLLVAAGLIGCFAGVLIGLPEAMRQSASFHFSHIGWLLFDRAMWQALSVAVTVALLFGFFWFLARKVQGDRRRGLLSLLLSLGLVVSVPLAIFYWLPRLLPGEGPLPFFANDLESFTVFLQRALRLKLSSGPLASPALFLFLILLPLVAVVPGLLLGRLAGKGATPMPMLPTGGKKTLIATLVVVVALATPLLLARMAWPTPTYPACGEATQSASNVLLISVDTLRADRLGCYGGPAKTPQIDALAARGVVVEQALSPSPWTLPAHAGMLLGWHPTYLGVVDVTDRLPEQRETLAQLLLAEGYRTAGFITHLFVSNQYGFDRGFLRFEYVPSEQAEDVVDRAIGWIDKQNGPWFAFCHFFDTHWPYTPERHIPVPSGRAELLYDLLQGDDYARALRAARSDPALAREVWLPRYDAEIEQVDAALGRLFAWLKKQGLANNTIIVFTSDHGEAFGEYPRVDGDDSNLSGSFGHGLTCQPGVIGVPMIFAGPRVEKLDPNKPARLDGLVNIVLQLAGGDRSCFVDADCNWNDGPMSPFYLDEPLVADTYLGGAPRYGVYAYTQQLFTAVDVRYLDLELHLPAVQVLLADGDESNLQEALVRHQALVELDGYPVGKASLSETEMQRLRQLGYVGGDGP